MAVDMKILLEEKFINDDLKRRIDLDDQMSNKLYPDFINKLHPENTYSTTEVAKFLGKHDSTLRNYLRNENLIKYIKPVRSGRFIRLNFESVFKLHMILIYLDQGKQIADIEILLGYRNETLDYNHTPINSGGINSATALLAITKKMEQTEKMLTILKNEHDVQGSRREHDKKSFEISSKKLQLEIINNKISNLRLEKRNQQLLTMSLKKALPQKTSLFSNLFKKPTSNVEDIVEQATKMIKEIDDPRTEELIKQKSELEETIGILETELSLLSRELDQKESHLLELKRTETLLTKTENEGKERLE